MKWYDAIDWGFKARNRIFMAPMDTLMAKDGLVNDFHIQHYGARAYGGVGSIIVESTSVLSNGLIRDGDLGIWSDEHVFGLARLAKIIKQGNAAAGIQLNHAGSKSMLQPPIVRWGVTKEYFARYDQGNLEFLDKVKMQVLEDAFVEAAHRAKRAGFDFVELHGAHGYLLCSIMHRLLNEVYPHHDIVTRSKLIIKIVKRIRNEVKIPVGMRFSITDHTPEGMSEAEYLPIIKELEPYLAYIHVSSGETIAKLDFPKVVAHAKTHLFRLPLGTFIKEHTKLPVIVVGNVQTKHDVQTVLAAKIDGLAIGRTLLFNPSFVLNSLATSQEIDTKNYHWNQSPWYDHHDYLALLEKTRSQSHD